jgi:hypothetical protein
MGDYFPPFVQKWAILSIVHMVVYTNMHRVPFQIDEEDYRAVSRYKWHVLSSTSNYIATTIQGDQLLLHQLLLGPAPEGMLCDHENRDTMDNRRANLRFVTLGDNLKNRRSLCHLRIARIIVKLGLDPSNAEQIAGIPDFEWLKHKNFGHKSLAVLRALYPKG